MRERYMYITHAAHLIFNTAERWSNLIISTRDTRTCCVVPRGFQIFPIAK